MSLEHSPARQGGTHVHGGNGDALDLLLGAKALAKFLNASERQIYYWNSLDPKPFHFFNIRDKIAGRKSTLAEDLARLEAGKAV
jgi:hypothetical protein